MTEWHLMGFNGMRSLTLTEWHLMANISFNDLLALDIKQSIDCAAIRG